MVVKMRIQQKNKQQMFYALPFGEVDVYERDDDGAEMLFVEKKEWASYNRQGALIARHRVERVKHVDDDLPKISKEYKKYLEDRK